MFLEIVHFFRFLFFPHVVIFQILFIKWLINAQDKSSSSNRSSNSEREEKTNFIHIIIIHYTEIEHNTIVKVIFPLVHLFTFDLLDIHEYWSCEDHFIFWWQMLFIDSLMAHCHCIHEYNSIIDKAAQK